MTVGAAVPAAARAGGAGSEELTAVYLRPYTRDMTATLQSARSVPVRDGRLQLVPIGQCLDYLESTGRVVEVHPQYLHQLAGQGRIPSYRTLTAPGRDEPAQAGARPVVLVNPDDVWAYFRANPPAGGTKKSSKI